MNDLHRRRGIDVLIKLADDEQQLALETMSVVNIRGLRVLHADRLTVAQTIQLDIKLELGQVTDSVTVEASAAQTQASEASLSQIIDEKRVRELPIRLLNSNFSIRELSSLSPNFPRRSPRFSPRGRTCRHRRCSTSRLRQSRTRGTSSKMPPSRPVSPRRGRSRAFVCPPA